MIYKYLDICLNYPFDFIVSWSPIFPVIVALINFKKLNTLVLKTLFAFLIFDLFVNISITILVITKIYNYSWLFNMYNLIEFLFFAAISYQLNHAKKQRKTIWLMCSICLGLFIYEFSLVNYGSILGTIEKAFLIALVFFYFNTLLSTLEVENIYKHPPFWIHTGLMVYASLSILNELATSSLINVSIGSNAYSFFWKTLQIATILFHLILAYAFGISKSEKTNDQHV